MFCHVASEQVIGVHDVSSVYHVPLLLQSQGIVDYLRKRLNLASLNITEEWISKGLSLEARWSGMTKGYCRILPLFIYSHCFVLLGRSASSMRSKSCLLESTQT